MAAIDTLLASQTGQNVLGAFNQGIQNRNLQQLNKLKLAQAKQQAPLQQQSLQNRLQQQQQNIAGFDQRQQQGAQNLELGKQRIDQNFTAQQEAEFKSDVDKVNAMIRPDTTPEEFQQIILDASFLDEEGKNVALDFGVDGVRKIANTLNSRSSINNTIQSSKINPDGSVTVVRRSGLVEIIPADEIGSQVLEEARDFDVETSKRKSQAKQLGGDSAKFAADAFKQVANINRNVINLRDVIRAVEVDGADTGPLAKRLPSVTAAATKLDNIAGRLGLDLISGVTFGALSEGELKFAIDTALPQGLQGTELVLWAKERINAQEKLATYLNEAAQFTSQKGNTVADFMAKKQAEKDASQPQQAQQQVQQAQNLTVQDLDNMTLEQLQVLRDSQ